MKVWAYLTASEYEQFKQKAESLNMTEGELAQKILLAYMTTPEQTTKLAMNLLKLATDFFTVDLSFPPQRSPIVPTRKPDAQIKQQAAR